MRPRFAPTLCLCAVAAVLAAACAAPVLAQAAPVTAAAISAAPAPALIAAPVAANAVLRSGTELPLRLLETLTTKGKQLRVGNRFRLELYGQSHHAFDNPEVGTDPNARLVYSPAAAARSRRAIAEFLREHTEPETATR